LQTGLGNYPGPKLALKAGFGNTAKSPRLLGHPELKYLLMNALQQFSIPFYVCVKNGDIIVDPTELCDDQVHAFRRFCVMYCVFNDRQFLAGYNYQYFDKHFPEKFSFAHNCKWPTGVSDEVATKSGSKANKSTASKCYNLMRENFERLLQRNIADKNFVLMNQSKLYHDAKEKLLEKTPRLFHYYSEERVFAMIHKAEPSIVSQERPEEIATVDNAICKLESCNTRTCPNTASKLPFLTIIVDAYKQSDAFIQIAKTNFTFADYQQHERSGIYIHARRKKKKERFIPNLNPNTPAHCNTPH